MRTIISSIGALALALTVACAGEGSAPAPPETADAATNTPAAPTAEQVARSTVPGVEDGTLVTLVDGRWEGEPYEEGAASRPEVWLTSPEDFWLVGDVDGDSVEEAVVHLKQSGGGTGTWGLIAVMAREGDEALLEAAREIGDRVEIRHARIEGKQIVLDVMRAGPQDGMCCPSELATLTLSVEEGELVVSADEVTGTASLESLAGQEWILRELSGEEMAPAEPEITLMFEDGAISGSSGCNNYSGSATAGELPTTLEVGPLAGTRMACTPEVMEVEQRYLGALQGATGWGIEFSRLAVAYQQDENWDQLVFEPR